MPLFNTKFQLVLDIVKIVKTIAAKLLFLLCTTFDMLNANSKLFNKLFIAFKYFSLKLSKNLALALFYFFGQETCLHDQSRFCASNPRENVKIFNIISKYHSFFNNTATASWVAHITMDFLTCYSSSYYSSMLIFWNYLFIFHEQYFVVKVCVLFCKE